MAVADLRQVLHHEAAEAVGQPQVHPQLKTGAVLGEILLELAGRGVQAGRRAQDARADSIGERG